MNTIFLIIKRLTFLVGTIIFIGTFPIFAQQQNTVTLNFNTLQNNEIPREYYNGGFGSLGSGPGPSYSISFGGNEVGGDSGKVEFGFTTPQLRNSVGRDIAINIPAGVTKITYQYAQPEDDANAGTVTYAFTGINRTGQEIIRVQRPRTSAALGYNAGAQPVTTLEFSSVARTVVFGSPFTRLAIDNVTFYFAGSQSTGSINRISDFDGDRRADAAVFRNGTWFVKPSGTTNNNPYGVQFGTATDKLAPADYDGDGKSDIAVWREGSFAYFYILQSLTNTVRAEQFGQTGDVLTVGDWDGDNKADPSVYRAAQTAGGQSYFYYRPSLQSGVNFVPVNWGTSGDEAVRGDFDGDGKMDAAVFRASDGIWYIRQSSNSQARYAQWGVSTDKRVSGDWDGDGKTDLAIYRDGLWAILQSSNSSQRYQQFGAASDKIVAADYDGDGKTDFAVFRNGVFYVLNNSSLQSSAQSFGVTGDVPVASAYIP